MAMQNKDPGQPSKLSKEQKTGFVFLFVFALLTVSLGFLQMRNTIYNPFVVDPGPDGYDIDLAFDENVRLQQIDTDGDGLNDFEEINFHETSAYIPDTDSDGISDGDEIAQGKDPLCPEGQECGSKVDDSREVVSADGEGNGTGDAPFGTSLEAPVFPQWALDELEAFAKASETSEGPVDNANLEEVAKDPKLLRALLLSTGELTEAQLAEIDDATILSLAEELLGEEAFSQNTNSATTTNF